LPWLDCYDIDSTLASLSAAIGTESAVLERVLCDYDSTRSGSGEDPEVRTPRDVLEQLGTTDSGVAERLAGAYCFHGTRVLDPETIRKCGLLPTTRIVEELWATLRQLVHDEINDQSSAG
jgi:hypothetical protein